MGGNTPRSSSGPQRVMDRATQYERNRQFNWNYFIRLVAKVMVVICGLVSLYILLGMSNGTMTCECTNEVPCLSQGAFLVGFLRNLWRRL